ncbi:MAG TPA: RNA polymerase sigma factor [Gemmatimonadaceae bacterium]|nr:RNA polymerase sigma factor [Gemmatimonadaceae bacterium]
MTEPGSSDRRGGAVGTRAVECADDADLIARWRRGDERAATLLVERHADAVARFVASFGVRDEIDELVQDAFVRAFGSLDGFRGQSSFRTWLFTIARNLVRDRARSAKVRRQVPIEEEHAVTDPDPLSGAVAEETEERIRRAVAVLSPMQREVFTLRVVEGLSYKEIAEVLQSTEGAARVHYHNAMRSIKECFDE